MNCTLENLDTIGDQIGNYNYFKFGKYLDIDVIFTEKHLNTIWD